MSGYKIDLQNIDTDVAGDSKTMLISILEQFTDFFQGFPRSRVNTAELEIRLQNPNLIVQMRPFCFSAEER